MGCLVSFRLPLVGNAINPYLVLSASQQVKITLITCILLVYSLISRFSMTVTYRTFRLSNFSLMSLLTPPAPGILFILATKQALSSHESEEEVGPDSLNVGWEKMVLIMFVMTLHSLTEGVGEFVLCLVCVWCV